jgi:DNA-binding HxlR family transcriptional regulator
MATTEIAGVQAALDALSSKWAVAILAELADGTHRFNELLRHIDGVSRRMLTATLRRLEQDGLVVRRIYADVPVRVEYDLSAAGEQLFAALTPLAGWADRHHFADLAARAPEPPTFATQGHAREARAWDGGRGV